MADDADKEDKTEAASAKRLEQAREAGQAPLSQEVAGVAVLASAAFLISVYMPTALQDSATSLTRLVADFGTIDVPAAMALAGHGWVVVVWPFVVAAMVVGGLSVLLQTRFLLKTSALSPDFSKLSPLSGFSRVFGPHNLMEAGKSALKIGVMGVLGWNAIEASIPDLRDSLFWTPGFLAIRFGQHLVTLMIPILSVQGAIAGFDVLRSQIAFNTSMKMTRQEQRDEQRDADGDPQIKGKLKQMRLARARKRMMAAVPKATVVVTNPTHYAVALAYERGAGGAPMIVAKGMDDVAARIRQVAKDANVPIVANPPLARALYPFPLDSEVPAEHFKAVAELIAYVWRLKGAGNWRANQ